MEYRYYRNRLKTWLRRGAGVVAAAGIAYSCASIGTLEGGPVDEDPPMFLESKPQPGSFGNGKLKRISIAFDEFIKLDKPNENVVISPPQRQQPEIKASGKRVIVKLADTMLLNTTYTIDFGDAIQDNNEGNPLEGFTFTFSTGDRLDTMAISGTVLNASDLEPVKGLSVGLYANLSDTAFTALPFERVGRTDSRGRFSIRGVAPGEYHIFALQDGDQNFYYSQPGEAVAFFDSLVVPAWERRTRFDTIWMDTITIDTILEVEYTHYLPDDVLLRSFKAKTFNRRLGRSERATAKEFTLNFTAPADTLPRLEGLNFDAADAFLVDMPTRRPDTLHYWIKDSMVYKVDTLKMRLTYFYTDTLNRLVPRTDTLKLVSKERPKSEKELKKEQEKEEKERKRREEKGEPPLVETEFLKADVYCPSQMDVYDYITLTFTEPLSSYADTAIHLRHQVDSLWKDVPFRVERDSFSHEIYNIYPNEDWEYGGSYTFAVDSTGFRGLYGLFTDKIKNDFKIKTPEEYGAIFFNIGGLDTVPAFVELLNEQDKVLRTVDVADGKADFYFLNPGKYGARLVADSNGNRQWDTGDYAKGLPPEPVYYYWQLLELKANFELTQTWNLKDRPLDQQKPSELKKQKPDEKKKKNSSRR